MKSVTEELGLYGTFVHVQATSVVIEGKLKVKHQRERTSCEGS